jgi:hypothetical protein
MVVRIGLVSWRSSVVILLLRSFLISSAKRSAFSAAPIAVPALCQAFYLDISGVICECTLSGSKASACVASRRRHGVCVGARFRGECAVLLFGRRRLTLRNMREEDAGISVSLVERRSALRRVGKICAGKGAGCAATWVVPVLTGLVLV